jgi:hypothetical protein
MVQVWMIVPTVQGNGCWTKGSPRDAQWRNRLLQEYDECDSMQKRKKEICEKGEKDYGISHLAERFPAFG